jgi:glycosyltransferase involved in cell wall biosynthesis
MRILLLSAYDADSHRYWRENLLRHLECFEWRCLTLPPRHFSWRIRGNPVSWVSNCSEHLSEPYDLLLATSMVDVATIKGLVPSLASTPTLVYFHENQFAFPASAHQFVSAEPQMVNLYSALASDTNLFNSHFNLESFIDGVEKLMARMPDQRPRSIGKVIREKSKVLPVPLENGVFERTRPVIHSEPLTFAWNHRWEYDKAPERLYRALHKFRKRGLPFRIHVLGRPFRKYPPIFDRLQQDFSAELGQFGRMESRRDYLDVLRSSHVVISTALQEFQGLSVLEATACGCIPLAPARLSYPEFLAEEFTYASSPEDEEQEANVLAQRLEELATAYANGILPQPPRVEAFSWKEMAFRYRELIETTCR